MLSFTHSFKTRALNHRNDLEILIIFLAVMKNINGLEKGAKIIKSYYDNVWFDLKLILIKINVYCITHLLVVFRQNLVIFLKKIFSDFSMI